VNRLPPVGLRVFSVGDTGALLDGDVVVVLVVVVVVVDGAGLPLLPHPALSVQPAMSTAPMAATIRRRPMRGAFTLRVLSSWATGSFANGCGDATSACDEPREVLLGPAALAPSG
jgi:hypothetical protein